MHVQQTLLGKGAQVLGDERHLPPFPADLILVLLYTHVGIDALAAHKLKVGVATICLHVLSLINNFEVLPGISALRSANCKLLNQEEPDNLQPIFTVK